MQDSFFAILLRFRQYPYFLTVVVEKMFRQINLHENDRNFQLILWRDDDSKPIQTLRLNTVTVLQALVGKVQNAYDSWEKTALMSLFVR